MTTDSNMGKASLDRARRWMLRAVLALLAGYAVISVMLRPFRAPEILLNVSYDGDRGFYRELNKAFARNPKGATVDISHAGSARQARGIIRGLQADVISLATSADIDAISRETDLIAPDWQTRLPSKSSPYASTIVFLVRAGNPNGIRDWEDLARRDVVVIAPSPGVSGAGRWAYLAAWGYALQKNDGDPLATERFVASVYAGSPVLDEGAHGALIAYARRNLGDVLLTWENEAWDALDEYGSEALEIVYPSMSILAEPVVSLVDRYVDQRDTRLQAVAYLEFLFSAEAQEIAARHHLRPRVEEIAERYAGHLPKIALFALEAVFGDWDQANRAHFDPGGTYERIHRVETLKRHGE